MKSYITQDGTITSAITDDIQLEILAEKVDNNSLMVENTSERKNKTLSTEYFTTNSRTIVNAINKTYKETQSAVDKATDAMTIVKDTIGDLENNIVSDSFANLKQETGTTNLIEAILKISKNSANVTPNPVEIEAETDFIDFSKWEGYKPAPVEIKGNNVHVDGETIIIDGDDTNITIDPNDIEEDY